MFELIEHTADLGLRVRAPDLDGLFRDAARGLFAIVAEPEPHGEPIRRRGLVLEGDSHALLLFDWLNELLFVFDTTGALLGEFDVHVDQHGLRASAAEFDSERGGYRLLHEVKAITYHGLRVERTADGWLAEVIVDI